MNGELPPYRTQRLPASSQEYALTALEEEIIEGRLAPGSRLREDDLARRLDVSRTPIREALHALERRGLVVRSRGKGTLVTPFLSGADLLALYEVRVELESHLAARAAEHITERELAELDSLHESFAAIVAHGELDCAKVRRLVVLDSSLHFSIYHAARSELLLVVESYWGRIVREGYPLVYRDVGDLPRFRDEHAAIVDALRARDATNAASTMTDHLAGGRAVIRKTIVARRRDA